MNSLKKLYLAGVISASVMASSAIAGIPEHKAAQLGGDKYTPLGAERAGNADGSIPAWTGGLTSAPSNWKKGDKLANPFPDEKPLFEITAANYEKYQDALTPGQIALLKKYPNSFKMPVYPTHRTAAYPQDVYDKVKAGASKAELVTGGNGLVEFVSSTPFPMPETGLEAIWNHIVRFRGAGAAKRTYTQIPVQTNGSFSPVIFEEVASFAKYMNDNKNDNALFYFVQKILAPPRLEGEVLLVHETLNQVKEPRQAWIYNSGQRRVRRAPNVAYDGPGTASDGLRTADDLDLFNGAPNKYEWKLKGKKELYIPYNAYDVMSGDLKYSDIIKPGHMNPEHLRYEKHRVWVVDAKLKDGERHIYARRTFYIDEDTWQISVVDIYDGRGELWKVKEGHALLHYHKQVPWLAVEALHDLISGRYLTIGLDNEEKGYQYDWGHKAKMSDFTPAALRRSGRR